MMRRAPLLHISIAVDDVACSVAFLADAFGYEVTLGPLPLTRQIERMAGARGLTATLAQMRRPEGDGTIELIAFAEGEPCPGSARRPAPLAHLAFAVPDLEAALDGLRARGAEPLGEVVAFEEGRSVYLRAPGGMVIELEEGA